MSTTPEAAPGDVHDAARLANVRPPDWRNPVPAPRYDLVVIGAGAAGLITSLLASSLGARVALVERHLMGGDCLNVGCVPSKALIRAGRLVQEGRRATASGLAPAAEPREPEFRAAMERMRRLRARISHEDSAERYRQEFGVDVFFGNARFGGSDSVDVDGTALRFRKAVIATGARATLPPIEGLAQAGPLTNETVFELRERPARLAVIGAGPIGCELAQTFQRLGSRVVLLEQAPQILIREDPDAAGIVHDALVRDGVALALGAAIHKVERPGAGSVLHVSIGDREERHEVDAILVGAGRAPNVEGLDLERVGVAFDSRRGIAVDDRLRTSNRRIWAAGDVCMDWKFTHAADAAAKLVVQNALFGRRKKLSSLVMPWCTYTDPEVAHVGLYERDARERGIELDTWQVPIARSNRALLDGQEDGFVKIHTKRGTDRIVGATIVAAHAGELIAALCVAMTRGIGLGALSSVILPYPTQTEAIKAAAGLYTRTRLTPGVKRLLGLWRRLAR